MLMLSVLGLIGALALIKVAMGGLGGLERGSIALLCAAATVCAVGGLVENAQLSVPGALLLVVFAADRQRRVAGIPLAEGARRPLGYVRYVAIAATDVLLLLVSRDAGGVTLVVAVAVVLLTAIVVARQIGALWENRRLLRRVDDGALKLDRYQQQLVHRTNHDQLTGLANRALFEQQTRAALAVADPATGGALSLALIDLDDFKAINDRLGHAVGDALLVVVAQRLRDCVRNDDVIARLGGDEFGLLLHGLRGSAATAALARISQALSRPVHALGYDLLVHASVGLAEVWPDASPQELLRRADVAMYAAKERGKGRHAVYDEQLEQDQTADAQLGAALRRALDNSEFSLVYQPIVALPAGTWTGLEALVRWHSPERGFVGPDTFIPIAERTGLIVPLGDWILRTALRQGVAWDQQYGSAAPREIGVNVSARQLREPGFADDVRRALAETGFDPERLVVEVTETAVFDGGVALDALHSLVGLGVKIALDDFGTGHSSLGLLRTCPTDTLKVDKSFVDGIGGRSEEAVIATAMIQITDGLHLQAIAEGVETAEQAETLYRLGYRFAQGYHFSRPLSREQVGERLDETVAPLPA
jgi:diguanylate cyclase (GGDEF)-like protein